MAESFSVIGLTERFEESLAWMMIEYGWDVPHYQRFRRSSKRPADKQMDPEVLAKIEELNAFDIALYQHGQQLFDAAMERNAEEVAAIRKKFSEATPPSGLRSYVRAGVAWSRALASMVRSAT